MDWSRAAKKKGGGSLRLKSLGKSIIVVPESVQEAGILQWLSKRYEGNVKLTYDTTTVDGVEHTPALWITNETV